MKHTHTLAAARAVAARGSTTGPHAPYMLIVHVLVDKIRSGELKPGDRVPSATELVQTCNISPSTARRALAKLKEMGLTDTVPGYATFVRFPGQDGASRARVLSDGSVPAAYGRSDHRRSGSHL
jgi:DNA-binding GntR family transcriptional regulator